MSDQQKIADDAEAARKKAERKAKMTAKMQGGQIQDFIPKWMTEPIEIEAKAEEQTEQKIQGLTEDEKIIFNSLLSINDIKQKIKNINAETNPLEIQKIYNSEMEKNEDIFAKLKTVMNKNPDSVVKLRRGPVIGMRTVAIKKGLSVEQILKNVSKLAENECFEIFYFCIPC